MTEMKVCAVKILETKRTQKKTSETIHPTVARILAAALASGLLVPCIEKCL